MICSIISFFILFTRSFFNQQHTIVNFFTQKSCLNLIGVFSCIVCYNHSDMIMHEFMNHRYRVCKADQLTITKKADHIFFKKATIKLFRFN